MNNGFHSIYSHNFVRAAVCSPDLKVAYPAYNAEKTLQVAREASEEKAAIALFPELGISGYSNDDLFHQDALLDSVMEALERLVEESVSLNPIMIVGAPLCLEDKLFNCGIVIYRGKILGVVPKSYIPNYREFYEKRQFCSARDAIETNLVIMGQNVPFGNDLVFDAVNMAGFAFHIEICEDVWVPIPPSTYAALAGATVLVNLSASNATVGKAAYRRSLCAGQSAKCLAAYLYSAAGPGESTTDLGWDGHTMIYENNELLAESDRFKSDRRIIIADIDLDRLIQERMRMTSFNDSVNEHKDRVWSIRKIPFNFMVPEGATSLNRRVERFPYVPNDPAALDERCYEAYNIQVHGLAKRMQSTGIEKIVIGISGGLDSSQALIVAAKTMDYLGLPRENILAYTMPGFATGDTTQKNARALMEALGVTSGEIDIKPSSMQMLKDIDHPYSRGKKVYDVTFENVQAGDRISHLFRLANMHGGLVLGTSDLSELALGWTTYGVGDHMSHYAVNASVPKTLIQHLIRWTIGSSQFDPETDEVLQAIVDTEISPELVPDDKDGGEGHLQSTEKEIGPYELQDFNLYYTSRFGYRPSKIAFMASSVWSDRQIGEWPESIPHNKRHEYDLKEIKKWLEVFLARFFGNSQFKRSCIPNAPKVGSGGSLSPRGDWRAPSDSEPAAWLDELKSNVPDR